MPTYIVRPYHGYDCNSAEGFNNGRYLEPIEVEAVDEEEAIDLAIVLYAADNDISVDKLNTLRDNPFGSDNLYSESDHTWTDEAGNEYANEADLPIDPDTDQPVEATCRYRYEYIDFSADVELKAADDKPLTPFFVTK